MGIGPPVIFHGLDDVRSRGCWLESTLDTTCRVEALNENRDEDLGSDDAGNGQPSARAKFHKQFLDGIKRHIIPSFPGATYLVKNQYLLGAIVSA